ncbi:MFS transporter [Chloroflexota bacterium]
MIRRIKFPKIFLGWGLVATGSFLSFWGVGYRYYGLSALFKPLSAELGMSRAATSVVVSIGRVGGSFEGLLTGWLADSIGPRRVIYFGVFLFGLSLILMNFINSQWGFYLVWGVMMGLGFSASSGVPMNVAITNWFVKKRGLALGMRMMISAAFALPIITWLITSYSWRTACVVGGVAMLIIGLTLTKLFVRDHRPEYYGLLPDGAPMAAESKENTSQMIERGVEYAAEVQEVEFTFRQAVRTPTYWLLILSQIGSSITLDSLVLHFIPLLTDMGMSPTKAAATVTIASLSSTVSRVVSGFLADRVGKQHIRFVLAGSFLLQAGGIGLFVLNQTIIMVYPFLILYFITMSINLIVRPLIVGRYFGRKAIGFIRGSSLVAVMPLGILAPVYLGWVYDTTGSYETALTVIVSLLAASAIFMFLARPPKPPVDNVDISEIN